MNKDQKDPVQKQDLVEISLPENLSTYITPLVIMLGTILIAVAIFVTGNKISTAIKDFKPVTTTTTAAAADTTAQAQAEVTVTDSMLASLWDKSNVIKLGSKDAKVHFVEFSDPSCPYCHIAGGHNSTVSTGQFKYVADGGTYVPPVPEMKKLLDEGKASFMYVFTVGHGNGELGAKALYCANEEGKFWQAHDLLMSNEGYTFMNEGKGNSDATEMAKFLASATDQNKMQSCLDSGRHNQTIQDDIATAGEFGVQGTPGFLVNTTRFAGAYSYNDMKSVVDAAL